MVSASFSVCSLKPLGSYFVRGDKVSKTPFCAIGPKGVIITLSVIIPFLLSASRKLFSHISYFRIAHIKPRRSTLLSPSLVNRLSRFAVTTLYPLSTRQSLVAVMCFSLVLTGLVWCWRNFQSDVGRLRMSAKDTHRGRFASSCRTSFGNGAANLAASARVRSLVWRSEAFLTNFEFLCCFIRVSLYKISKKLQQKSKVLTFTTEFLM